MDTPTATCTLAALAPSLRDLARELVDAGCTVQVSIPGWNRAWTNREVGYFTVTKADLPGIVIVSEGGFPLLGEPPSLTIPVHPNRVYGSAVLADVRSDETLTQAVLRILESDTVTPRFVDWTKPPVPVEHRTTGRDQHTLVADWS
jgi:hypothetical protein